MRHYQIQGDAYSSYLGYSNSPFHRSAGWFEKIRLQPGGVLLSARMDDARLVKWMADGVDRNRVHLYTISDNPFSKLVGVQDGKSSRKRPSDPNW